jgi:hypothetical protein
MALDRTPEVQFSVLAQLTDMAARPGRDRGTEQPTGVPVNRYPDLVPGGLRRDVAQALAVPSEMS